MADKDIKVLREQPNGSFKEVVLGDPVDGTIVNKDVRIQGTSLGHRLYIENLNNFDPGEPLVVDGRARIVHGMTFQAGINNFTNGSDHCHVNWSAQGRSNWQMIQNGGTSDTSPNYFTLHTRGKDPIGSVLSPSILHSIDTTNTLNNPVGPSYSGNVKVNWTAAPTSLPANSDVLIQLTTGAVGLAAGFFSGKIVSGPTVVSLNGLALNQYEVSLQGLNSEHWNPTYKGLYTFNANEITNQLFKVIYNFEEIQGTRIALAGNYNGVPRLIQVLINNHNAYEGESVVLKVSTQVLTTLPAGDYNAYVKQVLGPNSFVISVGNPITGWISTVSSYHEGGTAWRIIKGTTDNNHQYTAALQHIAIERLPTSDTSSLTTGGNKTVAMGNSAEAGGNFSYAFGYKSNVFGDKSSVWGGENNTIRPGAVNATIIGGKNNTIQASSQNVTIIGSENLNVAANTENNNSVFISKLKITGSISGPAILSAPLPVPKVALGGVSAGEDIRTLNPNTFADDSILNIGQVPWVSTRDLLPSHLSKPLYVETVILNKKDNKGKRSITVPSPHYVTTVDDEFVQSWDFPWPSNYINRTGVHSITRMTNGGNSSQIVKMNRPNHQQVTGNHQGIPVYRFLNGRFQLGQVIYRAGVNGSNEDIYASIELPIVVGTAQNDTICKRWGYSRTVRPLRIAFRYVIWDAESQMFITGPLSISVQVWLSPFPFAIDHVASTIAQRTVVTVLPYEGGGNRPLNCYFE